MEENCRCDECKSEKFDKVIGKMPLEERLLIRDMIRKLGFKQYLRGVIVTLSAGLLLIYGFSFGILVFL